MQSGKPVGVFRTHEWSPRVLIANSNLVPDWANWDEFRRLEALGLTMYGQMTAGSWIYIGSQGILQGTYECFAEIARRRHGGSLAGTLTLTAGLGGMGGAQPLAVTMNGGVALCVEVDRERIERRLATRYLDEVADSLEDAVARCEAAKAAGRALSVGLEGNASDVLPTLLARGLEAEIVTDQTSAHDPLNGYVPGRMSLAEAEELRAADPGEYLRRSRASMAAHCAAMVGLSRRRQRGLRLRQQPARGGAARRLRARVRLPRASCPPTCGRCSARAAGRFAGSRCPAIRRTSPPPIARCWRSFPRTRRWRAGSPTPPSGSPSRGCRPGSAGSATASAARLGLRFNEMVRSGELSAPIVIGRDHLDSGSVASPYRETEAMIDESDAIADWPLLNALVNTASGASWVSIHHGGGVGIGRSIHAGMVCVADGTELAAEKLDRVLTADPGTGVMRHADAGYPRAIEVARAAGRAHPDARGLVSVLPVATGRAIRCCARGRARSRPEELALRADASG